MAIEQQVSHPNLEKYAQNRPEIPSQLKTDYEATLSMVMRWEGGESPSRKAESDLDHIDASLGIINEVEEHYPVLSKSLNLEDVRDIAYLHDSGEIVAKDLPRSHPEYDNRKIDQKRLEHVGFWRISKQIEDPELRKRARAVYNRYENYKGNDPEAVFAKLVDKIQAVRFALVHVYDMTKAGDPKERSAYLRQASTSIELIFEFARPLLSSLPPAAAGELSTFLQLELGRYKTAGYPEIHLSARNNLFKISNEIRGGKNRRTDTTP